MLDFTRHVTMFSRLCFHNGVTASLVKRLSSHAPFNVGDKASMTKIFTAEDVKAFSELTGDYNPIHFDTGVAKASRFGDCIVHGVLTVGLLSAVMGMKLPGPGSIVLSYDIVHPEALFVGELVKAEVCVQLMKGRQMTLLLLCTSSRGKTVTKGTARLLVPKQKNNQHNESFRPA